MTEASKPNNQQKMNWK